MFLKDRLIEFLEYSSFSQHVFDYKVVDKYQTTMPSSSKSYIVLASNQILGNE